jgi:hypothetical protein
LQLNCCYCCQTHEPVYAHRDTPEEKITKSIMLFSDGKLATLSMSEWVPCPIQSTSHPLFSAFATPDTGVAGLLAKILPEKFFRQLRRILTVFLATRSEQEIDRHKTSMCIYRELSMCVHGDVLTKHEASSVPPEPGASHLVLPAFTKSLSNLDKVQRMNTGLYS